jgi:7,8-dihydroneopterin aldolase/epimerase/oxygenase
VITVSLRQLRFFAFHGLHQEEKKVKGEFIVDLDLHYLPGEKVERIEDTINYAEVFALVKQRMELPEELLETLAMDLAEKIRERWAFVKEIVICIEKKKAPIHNFNGRVSVTYRRHY